jgi:hypothetical protein
MELVLPMGRRRMRARVNKAGPVNITERSNGKKCTMNSVMTRSLHQILQGDQLKGNKKSAVCGMYVRNNKCMQNIVRRTGE